MQLLMNTLCQLSNESNLQMLLIVRLPLSTWKSEESQLEIVSEKPIIIKIMVYLKISSKKLELDEI